MRPEEKNIETVVLDHGPSSKFPSSFTSLTGELVIDPREEGLKDSLTRLKEMGVKTLCDNGTTYDFETWSRKLRIYIDSGIVDNWG